MGKSVPPYSHVIDEVQAEFREFRRALRREDQALFDRLFDQARLHTASGVTQADPDPFRTIVLAMLIELLRAVLERESNANDRDSV